MRMRYRHTTEGFLLAALIVACVAASPAAAKVLLLDLQPAGGEILEGFVPVTPATVYSAARGFGWEGEHSEKASRGSWPDPLAGDCLYSMSGTLRIDLADGEYEAALWTGGFSRNVPRPRGVAFGLEHGETRTNLSTVTPKSFLHDPPADLTSEEAKARFRLWCVYVERRLPQYRIRLQVQGGALRLGFFGPVALAGMAVAPVGEGEQLNGRLSSIEVSRRACFEPVVEWQKERYTAPSGLTAADHDAGFALTDRVGGEPRTLDSLALFAARGQHAVARFAVYPLKNVSAVGARVGTLKASLTTGLPSESVSLFRVIPVLDERGRSVPGPLEALDGRTHPLIRGVPLAMIVAVEVPADARPGVYAGKIAVETGEGGKRVLNLSLRVLPFSLPPLDKFDGAPPVFAWYQPFPDRLQGDLAFLVQCGLAPYIADLPPAAPDPTGQDAMAPFKQFIVIAKAARDAAPSMPVAWDGFGGISGIAWPRQQLLPGKMKWGGKDHAAAVGKSLQALAAALQQAGIEERAVFLTALSRAGSIVGQAGKASERAVVQSLGKVSCRPVIFPGEPWELDLAPKGSYVVLGDRLPAHYASLKKLRERGVRCLFAPRQPGRFATGFFAWRANCAVLCGTAWRDQGDPHNPFDGDEAEARYLAFRTASGLTLTDTGTRVREGIADLRYLRLLDRTIAAAGKAAKPEQKDALLRATELRRSLQRDIRPSWAYYERMGLPSAGELDVLRWAVAEVLVPLLPAK